MRIDRQNNKITFLLKYFTSLRYLERTLFLLFRSLIFQIIFLMDYFQEQKEMEIFYS